MLINGHALDIHVRFSAVPDSRKSGNKQTATSSANAVRDWGIWGLGSELGRLDFAHQ